MPNIGAVLREEIVRVCRKEIRRQVEPMRKISATHRRDIAALKRKVAMLERESAKLTKRTARAMPVATSADSYRPMRFVAKGLVSLRARLGLSAEDFGRLMGASGQSVYNWEKGKSVPRKSQLVGLSTLRGIAKREALARLESMK